MTRPAGGGGVPGPAAPDDERTARAVWSRIAEPGDSAAHALVAERGAVAALAEVGAKSPETRWTARLERLEGNALHGAARAGIRVIIPGDDEWPCGLDDLGAAAPFCLWVRGEPDLAQVVQRSVSVVGARASTGYGEYVAAELGIGCGEAGLAVVSGAAYGIDGSAHRGALAADTPTVAVLACGVDRVYPRGHEQLLARIRSSGLLVSEVPPGSSPTRWRFLQRNRLIAALTQGTVVVEAAVRSGALGTARRAMELGRHLGAVPGPVTAPASAGCLALLRAGATCVTGAQDVLEMVSPIGTGPGVGEDQVLHGLPPDGGTPPATARIHDGLGPDLLRVLDGLPLKAWAGVPSVARVAGLDEAATLSALGRLEARGLARRGDGGWRRAGR